MMTPKDRFNLRMFLSQCDYGDEDDGVNDDLEIATISECTAILKLGSAHPIRPASHSQKRSEEKSGIES